MIRIRDIKLDIRAKENNLLDIIADVLMLEQIFASPENVDFSYEILRRSIDARKRPSIYYIYTVGVLLSPKDEEKVRKYFDGKKKTRDYDKIIWDAPEEYIIPDSGETNIENPPVIVGAGPAGLFCALNLARRGFCPVIIERGEEVTKRSETVDLFWNTGCLNTESNVQFGEGGAGTFSDGKLNTLTKDKNGRNSYVLKTFYEFGAPKEVTFDAKPHIGTDILKDVVKNLRCEIEKLGGSFLFDTKVVDIKKKSENGVEKITSLVLTNNKNGEETELKTDLAVLAIGHSARDTFEMLYSKGIKMESKDFAAGFRVIHPQDRADNWAYGDDCDFKSILPAADYKVTNETNDGRRVYSFCMCPGGYVVNASSEQGRTCVNGMSYSGRDSGFANSAIIVAVTKDDFEQDEVAPDHPLAGMYYQRRLESNAFSCGDGNIPGQFLCDFEADASTKEIGCTDAFAKGKVTGTNLRSIFSESINKAFIESMHKFGYTRKCFDDEKTLILGIEGRTSSPVRIIRDEHFESVIKGLYPCGEGAGYAGGITSAAADGLKVSEEIIKRYRFGRS